MDTVLEAILAQSDLDREIEDFLSHHGVKGQKWGVRKYNARVKKGSDRFGNRNQGQAQRRIDRLRRIASGNASKGDKLVAGLMQIPMTDIIREGGLQGGSALYLDRWKRNQNKIKAGKRNATDLINRLAGVEVRELNLGYKQPKHPKVL